MFKLAIAIIGALAILFVGIFGKLPSKAKLYFENNIPHFKLILTIIGIIALIIAAYMHVSSEIDKYKYSIFVTPREYKCGTGRNETFIMKVTNNKDYPVYQIHVILKIINGDLSVTKVKIEPTTEGKIKKDVGNSKGKISINFDEFILTFIEKGKDYPTIHELVINNISAHSALDYVVNIDASKSIAPSTLTLQVNGFSNEPSLVFGK